MALHRDIHWIGRQWAVTGHGMQLIDQKLQGFFDIAIAVPDVLQPYMGGLKTIERDK